MAPVLVVFDLDDTLYLERDFVLSGFAAADNWLYRTVGIRGAAETCVKLFATGVRTRIFDQALALLGVPEDRSLIDRLVEVYRTHEPNIRLAPDATRYFQARDRSAPCALLTDGPAATQQGKVRALALEGVLDHIVYTGVLGEGLGKPHPLAFVSIERWAEPHGLPLAYVADNPLKDFITPRTRGWWAIQIERPERVHRVVAPSVAHEAHARITSLDELSSCLRSLLSIGGRTGQSFPPAVDARAFR